MLKAVVCGAAAASASFAVYTAYKEFMLNEVLISITEYVPLTGSDTQSFTDLSSTVEGEVRVDTNTTSTYKFLLRLNAFFAEVGTRGGNNNNGRRKVVSEAAPNVVHIGDVEVNEILDAWALEHKHQVIFSPACTSHQALLRYKSRLHESFGAPVSVRDNMVVSVGPGQLQLSFVLTVHAAIMDLELVVTLPKKARVLSINTGGVGAWKPSTSSPREIVWYIGACGTGNNGARHDCASLATVPTHVQQQQQRIFGKQSTAGRRSAAAQASGPHQSPEREIPDETVVCPNIDDYPQAELGAFMERISFDMIYMIGEGGDSEDIKSPKRGRRSKSSSASRNETDSTGDAVPPPGVGLTYAIAATASSLSVKRLQVLDEQKNWDASKGSLLWRFVKYVAPNVDGPRLSKKVQYTTRFSQVAPVEVQY